MPTFFASDFHFGVDARTTSRQREEAVVRWLDHCLAEGADAIYLVGDLFEFWFEWRYAVPRGYVRFLGKLAEVADAGVPLHVFTGNHDLWMKDYLHQEVGATIHHAPVRTTIDGCKVFVGHGDGLGPGDYGYKRLKKVMTAPWAKWLYARLHPNAAIGLANYFSGKSRDSQPSDEAFRGPENEWLVAYSEQKLARDAELDYLIFGHRHLPIDYTLSNGRTRYLNLGEWLNYQTYVRLDAGEASLLHWTGFAPAPRRPSPRVN
ncbi:UDP-2,3-diacylglucosamine hydrolase [Neolewinella xylanilytica]|uniref:UDP-2,3-diacylglucosamine hydrolase n=1 Tax=Neolewinella xylanilytica TaxID=1514080 RepID=A0A2S6IBC6_9BACT|nr:UDP-2,3-diacylglucosamine diphosphatase [Neolewinella xylanilytica]PPK88811.1 UDP-2,3-diacylglucosamine hydrolase [Neolewinella xylanilytica]